MNFPRSVTVISDEVAQELPIISAFLREFKLPGLELRSFNGRAFKDLTRSDVAEIAAASRAEGWRVVGCATPVFKCDLEDATAIAAHREIFKRSLEVARELQCDLLRVFTFLRTPNPAAPEKQARVVEHLRGLLELAAGSGVSVGVENEHSCLAATAAETAAILAPLPADRIGAIWDPCNVLYVPGAAAPSPATWNGASVNSTTKRAESARNPTSAGRRQSCISASICASGASLPLRITMLL